MLGKRKRGGQKNNLNAVKKPWRSFWKRRALCHEDRYVNRMLEGYYSGLLNDKPGASEAEQRCIDIAGIARGASTLILAEAGRSGFITKMDGTWDLSPGAKELARFLSIELKALQTLGLERRAKSVPLLAEYIEAKKKQDSPSSHHKEDQ